MLYCLVVISYKAPGSQQYPIVVEECDGVISEGCDFFTDGGVVAFDAHGGCDGFGFGGGALGVVYLAFVPPVPEGVGEFAGFVWFKTKLCGRHGFCKNNYNIHCQAATALPRIKKQNIQCSAGVYKLSRGNLMLKTTYRSVNKSMQLGLRPNYAADRNCWW